MKNLLRLAGFMALVAVTTMWAVSSRAKQAAPAAAGSQMAPAKDFPGDTSPAAQEVMAAERKMEAAVVAGDLAYVDSISAPDLLFTHGDGWTTGGKPLLEDNRAAFLKRVENKQYLVRDLDSVKAEMHGDIAITYGRYIAHTRMGAPDKSWFSVWFERVYQEGREVDVRFAPHGAWAYVRNGPGFGARQIGAAAT